MPETLHALIAARLDGLAAEERRLLAGRRRARQDPSPATASPRSSGRREDELEPLLASLVRKEVLSLQADPRSPEHGQYGFLQDLVRQVAYETLSRHERKLAPPGRRGRTSSRRSRAPTRRSPRSSPRTSSTPAEADARRRTLRDPACARGGARPGGRAGGVARRARGGAALLDQAAELADGAAGLRAKLLVQAGKMALRGGDPAAARERLEPAIALHEQRGDALEAARAAAELAQADAAEDRLDDARARLEAVRATLEEAEQGPELALVVARLGRLLLLGGDSAAASPRIEEALRLAEALALDEPLVHALTSKAMLLMFEGRWAESSLLYEGALARVRAAELHDRWMGVANNYAVLLEYSDRYEDTLVLVREIEAQARQRGDREMLAAARVGDIPSLVELGRWSEALARAVEAKQLQASRPSLSEAVHAVFVLCEQGALDAAGELLAAHEWLRTSEFPEMASSHAVTRARLLRARSDPAAALAAAEEGLAHRAELGIANRTMKLALFEGLESALELGDLVKAEELLAILDGLRPGQLTPVLSGERARFHARVAARKGILDTVEPDFRAAEQTFGVHGLVFRRAVTELEHAEWLAEQGRAAEAEPLLAGACETFGQLEAKPWLERLAEAEAPALATTS